MDALVPGFYIFALSSLRSRDELERLLAAAAEQDPLTGLPNRAGFKARAAASLDACRRSGQPATIAMLDIDRFKTINDGWGHGAGDEVLRGVAQAARDSVRATDVFARFGGEEFILLMVDVGPEDALPLVERIRAAMTRAVPHPGAPEHRVTISAGLAAIEGHDVPAIELAAKAADGGLYLAKEAGRNRAIVVSRERETSVLPERA
ncbi:GGDEF domain-containing protein [Roseococcus sp. SYP-B2431]|uniref:GGDEF domain-containing protein n=1 Tax=Roseococcus sp. SYP-B2431 TaxID=2496640 RepID=UPI0013F426A0|nr:GGDEF domain-containing protein [Roseococcus sp. SYP-B2431]